MPSGFYENINTYWGLEFAIKLCLLSREVRAGGRYGVKLTQLTPSNSPAYATVESEVSNLQVEVAMCSPSQSDDDLLLGAGP